MSQFDLTGKVALVTGGNGGIGLGMARGLGEAGAAILVVGRNGEKNDAAVAALVEAGVDAAASTTDVTDEGAVVAMVDGAIARWDRLDILVNNAGINIRKEPQDLALAEWRAVIDTNLTSVFICCQAVYPHMLAGGGGKIINIGSMMSIFGAAFTPAYASSKGGIVQLTKATATAWAKDNIQVNAVLPGWIDTDMTRRGRREIEGLHEKVLARTPAARWGDARDMAGIAVFLSAPASDFVTGTAIPVDGGFSVQG